MEVETLSENTFLNYLGILKLLCYLEFCFLSLKNDPPLMIAFSLYSFNITLSLYLLIFTQWFIFMLYSYSHQYHCFVTEHYHITLWHTFWVMMNPQKWPLGLVLRKIFSLESNIRGKEQEENTRRYTRFGKKNSKSTLGISNLIYTSSKKKKLTTFTVLTRLKE